MVLRLCYKDTAASILVSPLDLALGSKLPHPEQPLKRPRWEGPNLLPIAHE